MATLNFDKMDAVTKATVELLRKFVLSDRRFTGKAHVAGGLVRDSLMGVQSKDVDVTVELKDGGILMARAFARFVGAAEPVVFERFGTAMVNLNHVKFNGIALDGMDVEFVQTRTEQYNDADGRKPETAFGTVADDVQRRDFTVNAMLFDLTSGEILDLVGGQADMARGIIRTPMDPNVILREDPLRILRAVRFASRFGWPIEDGLAVAIKTHKSQLQRISRERIMDELTKMVTKPGKTSALELLAELDLMDQVFPVLNPSVMVTEDEVSKSVPMLIALLAVKNAGTEAMVIKEMNGLKGSVDERKQAQVLFNAITLFEASSFSSKAMRKGAAMCAALDTLKPFEAFVLRFVSALPVGFGEQPTIFFDGDQLMAMFNRKAGKWVGEAIEMQRNAWFENPAVKASAVESMLRSSVV